MAATTPHRLSSERQFHDRQAAARSHALAGDARLRFRDDAYLDHETWVRPAADKLGDVRGRRVLDFGCGHGMASVVLARRGAVVTGFDLSAGYVAEARRRACANGVAAAFLQADGERLPFADGAFDAVWGNAVLHHLDLGAAGRELWRVLRPGGVAVFCEPWGGNPLLNLARRRLPYPGKDRTPDERPLRPRDVAVLRRQFPRLSLEGFQLLSMARRVLPPGRLVTALDRLDSRLLPALPALRHFCRYVVLTLPR
jgi:SAM-dependent methyltransferase